MTAAKLNIDELEAGYPLFCKALRLLILKGNSVKDIEKTVCWGHLETLNRCLPGRYKAPTYLMALIKRDIAKPNNYWKFNPPNKIYLYPSKSLFPY